MAELKAKPNRQSVEKFLMSIPDEQVREDCWTLVKLMKEITKSEPKMWGDSIVGFGDYIYRYKGGRTMGWFLTGFSPRKQNLTLYIMAGFDHYAELMKKLGKHKTGKSCLYINRIDDIHLPTLKQLVQQSVKFMSKISA